MLLIKLAQFAVRCALPPRRSESPVWANDNKPSCVLHLLGWFIGSRGYSSLERRPEFWVLHIELMMPSDHLILCHPFLLLSSSFTSFGVFSSELALHIRWPKYWSFSFTIISSDEQSGLISFRIDLFDLLAAQGLSRVFSSTTVQKHWFFSAQPF